MRKGFWGCDLKIDTAEARRAIRAKEQYEKLGSNLGPVVAENQ